jgi:hypothetical protein
VDRPSLPQIPTEETRKYLEDLAGKTDAVSRLFLNLRQRSMRLAESVRTVDASNFRDSEQILSALEERLISILRVAAEENVLVEVQRDVEAELGPFRSTMTTEQLAMLEQQAGAKKTS